MITGITATLRQTIPVHDHALHEFILSLKNPCSILVMEERVWLKAGCSLFIPGGVPHSILADPENPAIISFTCFDWQSCSEHLNDSLKPLLNRLSRKASVAENYSAQTVQHNLSLSAQLKEEVQRKDPYSQSMAGSILTQLLVNHIRDLGLHISSATSRKEQRISYSIDWIKDNLSQNIKLDDMARKVHMSRSLYSRSFRAYTGMSLISFIMVARVEKAAKLLAQCDETIMNIALSCGFQNMGHFHKAFKKHFRMTPKQYRQTYISQAKRQKNLLQRQA